MDTYQRNLNALKKVDTELYEKISAIKTNEIFEVFAKDDLANANILDTRDNTLIYELEPKEEIRIKIDGFKDYNEYKYFYFFGIGNGYFYKKLSSDFKKCRKIRIVEPELELIYIALNLVDLSNEIEQERICIHYVKDISYVKFNKIFMTDEQIYFKAYDLLPHTPFYEKYEKEMIETNKVFIQVFRHFVGTAGNDITDELVGLEHFLNNLPVMIKNPSLKNFVENAKTSKVAVIVATGPSLQKQLPKLKEIKDKVVIYCVDASLPILEKWDIKPDIVTSIERVKETAKFYQNVSKEFQKDIIFGLTSVVHQDVLDAITEGTKQISMRPTGTHYKFFQLDDWGYVGIGMSAANLAFEIASRVEYEKIVFIGQDLAFGEDGKSHSKDHIFGEDEVKQDKNIEYATAYGGKGKIKTMKWWRLFRVGLENQAFSNNIKGITTYNCTEGGARIEGTVEDSFSTVIDKFIINLPKKEKIELNFPTKEEYEKNLRKIRYKMDEAIKIGLSMIKNAEKLFDKSVKLLENIEDRSDSEIFKLMNEILALRDRYYYGSFVDFYGLLLNPLMIYIELDLCKINVLPENSKKEKREKYIKLIALHREWFTRVIVPTRKVVKLLKNKEF